MENKKTLRVNCAACDVRNVTEEFLSAYGEVYINAATIITSPTAQALLSKYTVRFNAANTISLDGAVRYTTVNGPMSITGSQAAPAEKLFATVNGPVDIEPGCEEVLKAYVGVSVNGPVTCPESMVSLLGAFSVNGPIRAYPDGAIRLKSTVTLDRIFHLRAKQDALYYAAGRIVALSPDIDFAKLAEKNVRFVTKKLLVAESLAEAALPLFDERTDIVILPDGCAYVNDDAELSESLLKRYGGKLYINGDLTISPDSEKALDQVSYLCVTGDLLVCRSLKDRVLEMDIAYGDLYVVGSVLITNRAHLELTAAMLADAEDGLSVISCATLSIAEDVTPELLKEKLVSIASCASVVCANKEQLGVVQTLSQDVASFVSSDEEDEEEETAEDENDVRINAAFYAF